MRFNYMDLLICFFAIQENKTEQNGSSRWMSLDWRVQGLWKEGAGGGRQERHSVTCRNSEMFCSFSCLCCVSR